MWVWTGESYRNIEAATEIRPALKGNKYNVLVKYPDRNELIELTGAQASGVLEYVLRRRVASTYDALEAIFKRVEEERDIPAEHNGNGHRPRQKRVLRDPETSKRRMREAALRRWAKVRADRAREEASLPAPA
jgi:hypothetical protein